MFGEVHTCRPSRKCSIVEAVQKLCGLCRCAQVLQHERSYFRKGVVVRCKGAGVAVPGDLGVLPRWVGMEHASGGVHRPYN